MNILLQWFVVSQGHDLQRFTLALWLALQLLFSFMIFMTIHLLS